MEGDSKNWKTIAYVAGGVVLVGVGIGIFTKLRSYSREKVTLQSAKDNIFEGLRSDDREERIYILDHHLLRLSAFTPGVEFMAGSFVVMDFLLREFMFGIDELMHDLKMRQTHKEYLLCGWIIANISLSKKTLDFIESYRGPSGKSIYEVIYMFLRTLVLLDNSSWFQPLYEWDQTLQCPSIFNSILFFLGNAACFEQHSPTLQEAGIIQAICDIVLMLDYSVHNFGMMSKMFQFLTNIAVNYHKKRDQLPERKLIVRICDKNMEIPELTEPMAWIKKLLSEPGEFDHEEDPIMRRYAEEAVKNSSAKIPKGAGPESEQETQTVFQDEDVTIEEVLE